MQIPCVPMKVCWSRKGACCLSGVKRVSWGACPWLWGAQSPFSTTHLPPMSTRSRERAKWFGWGWRGAELGKDAGVRGRARDSGNGQDGRVCKKNNLFFCIKSSFQHLLLELIPCSTARATSAEMIQPEDPVLLSQLFHLGCHHLSLCPLEPDPITSGGRDVHSL